MFIILLLMIIFTPLFLIGMNLSNLWAIAFNPLRILTFQILMTLINPHLWKSTCLSFLFLI